jgi:hypothetical protein
VLRLAQVMFYEENQDDEEMEDLPPKDIPRNILNRLKLMVEKSAELKKKLRELDPEEYLKNKKMKWKKGIRI